MTAFRQIIGILALALASVGPVPLWLHHAVCHTHSGCHSHAGNGDHSAHAHPTAESCCGHHPCTPAAALPCADDASGYPAFSQLDHDCFVCYQLSQATAASGQTNIEVAKLPPTTSDLEGQSCLIATLNNLYAPRGPPAV